MDFFSFVVLSSRKVLKSKQFFFNPYVDRSLVGSHPLLCTLRLSDSSCSPGSSCSWDCRSKRCTPDRTRLHPGRCPPLDETRGTWGIQSLHFHQTVQRREVKPQAVTHPRTGTLPPAPCHAGTRRWIPSVGLCSDGSSLRCWPHTHSDLQTTATTAQPHRSFLMLKYNHYFLPFSNT